MKYLPYGPQFYDEDTVTDQPERQIVAELIREKALRSLNEEVPHGIAVSIDQMKARNSRLIVLMPPLSVNVILTKALLSANRGAMLKKIGSQARPETEDMLGKKVNLKLWVKLRKTGETAIFSSRTLVTIRKNTRKDVSKWLNW